MTPKQIVQQWVEAFNRKDVKGLAELYTEEAINHQVNTEPLHGKEAIKQMFANEFANAEMVCICRKYF